MIPCYECSGAGTFHLVDMQHPDFFKLIVCEICGGTGQVDPTVS